MEKKNHFVRAVSVILAVLMLVTSAPLSGFVGLKLPKMNLGTKAEAYYYDDDYYGTQYGNTGIYYAISDGKVKIIGADESIVAADIPESINGYPVTEIYGYYDVGDDDVSYYGAFENCTKLQSVTIPSGVTSIEDCAFIGCTSLQSVTIPDSVTNIGICAFYDCKSLQSVRIPNSVTRIGDLAFCDTGYYNNSNNWKNGVLYIEKYLIEAKDSLSGSYSIENGTRVVAGSAFGGCAKLQSVTIPSSVTSIGESAFDGCRKLKEVNITDLSAWCKIDFMCYMDYYGNCDYTSNPICYASELKLNGNLITELEIPKGITKIKKSAFYGYSSLKSVTIPNSVTSIDDEAFCGCTGLKSVTIGNGVTSIGYDVFVGTDYYKNSSNWENGVLYIGKYLIEAEQSLSGSYSIKSGTRSIADYAFDDCEKLKSVTIPNSVAGIGSYAFYYCTSLKSVTIQNSVTSIGSCAFYYCTSLKSVTLSNGVTSIGDEAFYDCKILKSVTIPKSVTSIGDKSFGYIYNRKTYEYELVPGFTIQGTKDSEAEKYANENKIKFVEAAKVTTPAQVKSLKASAKTSSSVTLTWAKVSGASGYEVYKYTSSSKKYTKIGSTTSNSFKVSSLLSNTKYMFAVRAYSTGDDEKVYGKTSSLHTVTTSKQGKPAQVAKPKVTKITATTLTLSWTKVGGADVKYYVFYYNTKTKRYVSLGSTTSNTFTAKKLKAGTKYTLVVQSYGTKSKSWGKISSSVSTATAPVAPSITVTAGKKQATIKWNKVTGATSYTVYFATSKNGKFNSAGTTTKTSLTVSKLSSGKTYYFKVIANEKLGSATIKSAYSAVKSVKVK